MFTLHNGDCLEYMKGMPEKSVDCVITDPPYGMEYRSNRRAIRFDEIRGDNQYPSELIPRFQELARKAVFVFCRWDNLPEVPKPKSFIVWVKNNRTAGDLAHSYGRQWEGILFYPMSEHEFIKRPSDVIHASKVSNLCHPTEKPVQLICELIRNNTNPGDTIFDPFMGSGTTGVACMELGRKFIGCEIDETYFEIAKKRIEQAAQQLPLLQSSL